MEACVTSDDSDAGFEGMKSGEGSTIQGNVPSNVPIMPMAEPAGL
jgi:hypothetical protein